MNCAGFSFYEEADLDMLVFKKMFILCVALCGNHFALFMGIFIFLKHLCVF